MENTHIIHKVLDTMFNSDKIHGCFIWGRTSTGKSYEITRYLDANEHKLAEIHIINAHVTPLSLFLTLKENPEDVYYFDDLDSFANETIGILKGALWETDGRKRIVNWLTTSDKAGEGVEHKFEFKGKLIFSSNSPPVRKLEPLASRTYVINQEMEYKSVIDVAIKMCETYGLNESQKQMIVGYINPFIKNVNFRAIIKAIELISNGYEEDVDHLFDKHEELEVIDALINDRDLLSKEKVAKWTLLTGMSRRSYYNYLKLYNKEMKNYMERLK